MVVVEIQPHQCAVGTEGLSKVMSTTRPNPVGLKPQVPQRCVSFEVFSDRFSPSILNVVPVEVQLCDFVVAAEVIGNDLAVLGRNASVLKVEGTGCATNGSRPVRHSSKATSNDMSTTRTTDQP